MKLISQFFLCRKKFFKTKPIQMTALIHAESEGVWKVDTVLMKTNTHATLLTTLSEQRARAFFYQVLLDYTLNAREHGFFIKGQNANPNN